MPRAIPKVTVTYFKASGKYYADHEYDAGNECLILGDTVLAMDRVIDKYKMQVDLSGSAPGLSSNGKEFYKVFTAEDGYPVLIKPTE